VEGVERGAYNYIHTAIRERVLKSMGIFISTLYIKYKDK
jgi:hypothetical protein